MQYFIEYAHDVPGYRPAGDEVTAPAPIRGILQYISLLTDMLKIFISHTAVITVFKSRVRCIIYTYVCVWQYTNLIA